MFKKFFKLIKHNKTETILVLLSLIFSWWLMFSTFTYKDGNMLIATKAFSDFASHIPLIRSFSFGNNFPPEYPLFPGLPIHYHFLFYLFVGLLEKSGLRIDYSLNILSVIGFLGLLIMIYLFSKLLFKSKRVGVLSVILFLFNGSLSFVYFLKEHTPLKTTLLKEIILNNNFSSFAPYYGNGIVSAFWNLNIYTNQRHLAFSYGFSLLLIYVFLKKILNNRKISSRLSLLLGIPLGVLFSLNMAVFTMTVLIILVLSVFFKKYLIPLVSFVLIGTIFAMPFYSYLQSAFFISAFSFYPGYLINNHLGVFYFIYYWFYNLGLHLILIPLGVVLSPRNIKKFFISFFFLFIIANLFRFSLEIAANHKFINYFMILGVMFSSYALVWLWDQRRIFKPIVAVLIFFIVFSGIIDFFPIYNDKKIALPDYQINQDIKWIKKNTPENAIFLNSTYLYTPSSLAGRKIFLGWPYFAWSQGYDTDQRELIRKTLLNASDLKEICVSLSRYKINYIELIKNNEAESFNFDFFDKNFNKVYSNPKTQYYIYEIGNSCK